ncbi:MAG: 3'(2'),5'-bisphosphate nucleotidase [Methyloversatilis sp. 12-65-5]|nr:MAG: 3'(2'),5'-bisphosphate nucleotidase [Methyloversatilis sp. 12-65-5]
MKISAELETLRTRVIDIARDAGRCVMDIRAGATIDVRIKSDASPVTLADEQAHALITARLAELTPDVPIVSEEAAAPTRAAALPDCFWLVDPLDGTKEFIRRNGEFTVNIALIDDSQPVLGVVFAPALNQMYSGVAGGGAWLDDAQGRRALACRRAPGEGLTVIASRSHGDTAALDVFLARHKIAQRRDAGSSLKLCLIAAGEVDVYPRFGRTMEWDIAAGHAVLDAAGGHVEQIDGSPLRYGKPVFENPHFIAWGLRG